MYSLILFAKTPFHPTPVRWSFLTHPPVTRGCGSFPLNILEVWETSQIGFTLDQFVLLRIFVGMHHDDNVPEDPALPAIDFTAIEAELREIDDDFANGRMNAFGSHSTQEEIQKEFRKINDLELQVFFRAVAAAKATAEEEPTLLRAGGDSRNEGTGAAFEDIAKTFKNRELALGAVHDNLKQIARHIATTNDIVQRQVVGVSAAAPQQ